MCFYNNIFIGKIPPDIEKSYSHDGCAASLVEDTSQTIPSSPIPVS